MCRLLSVKRGCFYASDKVKVNSSINRQVFGASDNIKVGCSVDLIVLVVTSGCFKMATDT